MLVVSDKRLVPAQINTIVLQGEDGLYYYLHRDLYDQLVILSDNYKYGEIIIALVKSLAGDSIKAFEDQPQTVQDFYARVPWPLKAAAPFLNMVDRVDELTDFEDQCGALSVLSMSVNLRRVPTVPKEMRASLRFSLHVREEYKPQWDRFFQENPEFGVAVTLPAPQSGYSHISTQQGTTIVTDPETGEEEEISYASDPADFDFEAMMASMTSDLAAPAPAPSDPAPTPTAPVAAGGGSGFAMLDGI